MLETFERQPAVVHPCDSWARSIGYETWAAALAAINEGQVLAGPTLAIQPASKSALGVKLFLEVIQKERLHTYAPDEGGLIVIGHLKNFPADLLATQEAQTRRMAARLQMLHGSAQT